MSILIFFPRGMFSVRRRWSRVVGVILPFRFVFRAPNRKRGIFPRMRPLLLRRKTLYRGTTMRLFWLVWSRLLRGIRWITFRNCTLILRVSRRRFYVTKRIWIRRRKFFLSRTLMVTRSILLLGVPVLRTCRIGFRVVFRCVGTWNRNRRILLIIRRVRPFLFG